jgi:hypothetical protein
MQEKAELGGRQEGGQDADGEGAREGEATVEEDGKE